MGACCSKEDRLNRIDAKEEQMENGLYERTAKPVYQTNSLDTPENIGFINTLSEIKSQIPLINVCQLFISQIESNRKAW
jgi:hypothetical protein